MADLGVCPVPWQQTPDPASVPVRAVVFRPSGGAYRAAGSRDTSAVIYSDSIGSSGRRYLHELPMSHASLELNRIETNDPSECGSPCTGFARQFLTHAARWLTVVDRFQDGVGSMKTVEPSAVMNALREVESSSEHDAPDSLIYRIARDDRGRLGELCADPRVMLRRERQLCALGRVRELDAACMRWLDIQPGRTIAEKAGRKQQIRSIVRVRSAATLENRVLRDLLLRARAAGETYCRENSRFLKSTRVLAVRRFVQELNTALSSSVVSTVPALSGVPSPNYVLQNDRRYRHVWMTWLDLVRKRQLTQSLLWWGGRWIAELALLGALEALEGWEGAKPRLQHRLSWRKEPQHGEFFETAAPIGAYIRGGPSPGRFDVLRSGQIARGVWPAAWAQWLRLAPDWAIVPEKGTGQPLLAWVVAVVDEDQQQTLQRNMAALSQALKAASVKGLLFQYGGAACVAGGNALRVAWIDGPLQAPAIARNAVQELVYGEGKVP